MLLADHPLEEDRVCEGSVVRLVGPSFGRHVSGAFDVASSPVVRPQGLALDDTLLYIVDAFNSALAVYTKGGSFQNEYIGNFGQGPGEFRVPLDVACDKNNKCFVTNSNNQRIEVLGLNNFISLDVNPTLLPFTLLNRDFPLSQDISVGSNAPDTPWSASVSEQ